MIMLSFGTPSPEEQMLIALRDGQYKAASKKLLEDLSIGEPPRILSVVRPDILFPLADILLCCLPHTKNIQQSEYTAERFAVHIDEAISGNPAAISALPKFATTPDELTTALKLALEAKETLVNWREGRSYVQFTGSFSPMHIGHRAAISHTLEAVGGRSSALVQAVTDHPFKKDLPPYRERFDPGEQKLYRSRLIDPMRVTMIDVPQGSGLAANGCEQMRLLATVCGDSEMRWQVGSDKFLRDVSDVRAGKKLSEAGERFRYVHQYVVRRATEDPGEIEKAIEYVQERFGATVTQVPVPDDELTLNAAATHIRLARAAGDHGTADRIELSDLM
jgi:phosphopantetheine adenylyltransferase